MESGARGAATEEDGTMRISDADMAEMADVVLATVLARGCFRAQRRGDRVLIDPTGGLGHSDAHIEALTTGDIEIRKYTRERDTSRMHAHAVACVEALAAAGFEDVLIVEARR